jgi:hypothetical protein
VFVAGPSEDEQRLRISLTLRREPKTRLSPSPSCTRIAPSSRNGVALARDLDEISIPRGPLLLLPDFPTLELVSGRAPAIRNVQETAYTLLGGLPALWTIVAGIWPGIRTLLE